MASASIQRFKEIVKVLGTYGFGYIVDSKLKKQNNSPKNIRKAFEELGPTFIKIGQILSTRPDLLSPSYITELSKLQDNASAESFDTISKIFYNEFNISINDTFVEFDKVPLASASIAQVHKATLKDGRKVIVKIQKPNIVENMRLDLSILIRIFKLTKAKFSDALIDPEEAFHELLISTELELDFNNEAKNIIKFKELNKNIKFVYSPYLISPLCSSKVLTMERIDGFKIDDMDMLESGGYDLDDLCKKLSISFLKQILEDGFFHGDPHPGNLLVYDGKICYIDFGIMGNFSKSLKNVLNDMILSVAYHDINKMISALMSIGVKKGYVNRNKLYEDLDYLFASYLSISFSNIKISIMLEEVFDTAKRNNIQLPRDLTILIRSLIILEGVLAKISPDIKILDIAMPYIKSTNKSSLYENINIDDLLLDSYNFIRSSSKIPTKIIDLSDNLLSGRTKIQLEHKNLEKPINDINKAINRLVSSLIISSMIIGSSFILNSNIGPKIYDISIIGITGFLIAAIMGFWLLISIIKSGRM